MNKLLEGTAKTMAILLYHQVHGTEVHPDEMWIPEEVEAEIDKQGTIVELHFTIHPQEPPFLDGSTLTIVHKYKIHYHEWPVLERLDDNKH